MNLKNIHVFSRCHLNSKVISTSKIIDAVLNNEYDSLENIYYETGSYEYFTSQCDITPLTISEMKILSFFSGFNFNIAPILFSLSTT